MASLPRSRLSRLLEAGLRSGSALPRPESVSRRSYVAALSASTWSGVKNPASDGQFYQRQHIMQRRGCAGGFVSVSRVELKERVLNVIKFLNKEEVTPEVHVISDLGINSLDTVGVVTNFKDDIGVEMFDEETEEIHTCKHANELLQLMYDPT